MKVYFHFHKAVFSFLINCITKNEQIYNVILKIHFDFALEVWFSICRRLYNYISLPRRSSKQKASFSSYCQNMDRCRLKFVQFESKIKTFSRGE